ncbi:adenine deaminase [Clostridium oryzae]|uniref:Adenine deaminase n=1 Tax=Clostridium oryzae TaxID=1450648 RepID=A0A1V4IIA0_9CLOT|nr:adenine deaminase [Clostridium oryzae]OPJ59656.1 adenine deaminase [Clostridium oryzae]
MKTIKEKLLVANGFEKADLVLKNGNILNVFTEEIVIADVAIVGTKIVGVGKYSGIKELDCTGKYIVPGFIDAHMHIESTMVTPLELSKMLVVKGTTTIIADPHEIVNVKGIEGLDFIISATEDIPISAYIMVPSSVPATEFDTNGAGEFLAEHMSKYVNNRRVLGLGEMMCFRDVINGQQKALDKIQLFHDKIVDGHAPGINGYAVQAYRLAGVDNDHECYSFEEALDKLRAGMHIFIREGSGARNLQAIVSGFLKAGVPFDQCMFCTDDKHLEDIETEGHINYCIRKAIELGVPIAKAYKMASYNTAKVYGLKQYGAIGAGYIADIIIMDNLEKVEPKYVIKNGKFVDANFISSFKYELKDSELLHTVKIQNISESKLKFNRKDKNHVIGMIAHQITTKHLYETIPGRDGEFIPNKVYSKLCVVERHGKNNLIGIAPIKGFGIENGAIATSVSHDSHNIIVAGDNDEDIINAVNHIKHLQGGYAISSEGKIVASLPLPIGGLMSNLSCNEVKNIMKEMLVIARKLGVNPEIDPFITLSFMALPVIPEIRLTEKGIFDVEKFEFVSR